MERRRESECVKTYSFPSQEDIEYINFQTAIHFYPLVSGTIAPEVISFNYNSRKNKGEIIVKKLINRDNTLFRKLIEENYDLFNNIIYRKVNLLHEMDICHGDLHLDNIVLSQNPFDVFFIDWDKAFYISKGFTEERVLRWMKEAFDFNSYDEFVQNDYENYKPDLDDMFE